MPTTLDGDRGSADQAPEVIRLPTRSNEDPFTDEDIRYVSENLSRAGQRTWSKLPRIYVVLRRTNLISSIKAFIEQDITDLAFPFSNRTLPHALSDQDARQRFLDAQHIVLSKVLELERGSKHYHFSRASDVPLVKLSELGKGGFGSVDRVRSEISFREYARKLIPRGPTFRKDRKILKDFENELNNLRKLSHQHIVQLVGSYTDPQFVGIIMYPVAEYNLKEYLAGPFVPSLVQTFFGCLATAVRFLHENRVRHKDIKPQNVLVNRGSVLLTDFGISRDWTEAGHSTTSGPSVRSIRYCAPEVADSEPRNSSSDIWSLGCVFLEMWTVLSGHSIDSLAKYLQKNGTLSDYYQLNPTGITSWCGSVLSVNSSLSGPLFWIQNMLVMEREDRWTIQMVSDEIQEYSETSVVRFVGHCCDVNIGSPETVDSTLDYVRDSTTATTVEDSRPSRASTSESTPITSLDSGGAVLAATSRVNDSTSSSSIPNSPFASLQINTSGEMSKKRSGSEIGVEASTQPAKRHQPHLDRRPSQSPGLTTAEALNSTERRLPKSFLAANSNRFSREQVLDLLNASNPLQERTSRSTRGLRSSEKAVFTYGDHMLPTALYEGTCVRSKPSQYARWTTLKGLVEHMMPATLRGYVRLCPDASEGLASIPTVRATGSPSDEVHGMIIFCWHDSHTSGSRKYESKNEHDVQEAVFLELKDGSEMDVEATIRVWNDDVADALVPYNGNWQPINLLEGEWYSLTPASVLAEDANIQLSPTDEDNNTMDSFQMENSETVGQAIGIDVQPVPQPVGLGVASVYSNEPVKLTNSLVSGLFYQQARYFILKGSDNRTVGASQSFDVWSSTPPVNKRLHDAFNTSERSPVVLFIMLAKEGFYGVAIMRTPIDRSGNDHPWVVSSWKNERFSVAWISKSHIPFIYSTHLRVKSNVEGSNQSLLINSCRDGTEISQYSGSKLLHMFEALADSSDPASVLRQAAEDSYDILPNPAALSSIRVTLNRLIKLESKEGDFALAISSDGKFVAGGSSDIEVFDVENGDRLWKFSGLPLDGDEIHGASFNHDTSRLAAGGERGNIYLWDLQNGSLIGTLTGHSAAIFQLEYAATGSRIVSTSEDKTIRVWDAQNLTNLFTLPTYEGCVNVSVTRDCSRVFTGTLGGRLVSWRLGIQGGDPDAHHGKVHAHEDSIFSVRYVPAGNMIVTGSRDKSVKVWSCDTSEGFSVVEQEPKPLKQFLGHKDSVYAVSASPDGKIVFSASGDGSVRLWDLKTGETVVTILGDKLQRFHDVVVCQEKNVFATAHGEGLQIWTYESHPETLT